MPFERQSQSPAPKKPREPHKCIPIPGERGRFRVASRSAAKAGEEEEYIVDVLATEETVTHGLVTGTCPCKGWGVRKTCTHLDDCKAEFVRLESESRAERLGFPKLSN